MVTTNVYTEGVMTQRLTIKIFALLLTLGAITALAFYIASLILADPYLQAALETWGVPGAVLVAFIASLNAFIPIPPAAFAPIFLAAGLSHLWVIVAFAIGASFADSVSYLLGSLGRSYTENQLPKVSRRIHTFFAEHQRWILPAAYLYMGLAPLPNEYIMVPLALAGYKYHKLILPLLLGNVFYFTWTVLGYDSFFAWLRTW